MTWRSGSAMPPGPVILPLTTWFLMSCTLMLVTSAAVTATFVARRPSRVKPALL